MRRRLHRYAIPVFAQLTVALPALSGTIPLAWDPVTDPNLAGYRVYYGRSPGAYTRHIEVGNTPSGTVTGLTDCTPWYLAVKAFTNEGVESEVFSNEVSGWAQPVVTSVTPSSAKPGSHLMLNVGGIDFAGGATVRFDNPAISVNSISLSSCTGVTADVTIAADANLGATNVEVINADGTRATLAGGFTVAALAGPAISSESAPAVDATTATITWTTDVASTSLVLYRRSGETGYQRWRDLDLVTAHAAGLHGLTPETVYEYHVKSRSADGYAAVSEEGQFTTLPNDSHYIQFEAEAGKITAPVVAASGIGQFGAGSVTTPAGTTTGSPSHPSGTVTAGVNIPSSGNWYVWVRVYAADQGSSGWLQSMDDSSREAFFAPVYGQWTWAGGRAYALQSGLHTQQLGGYDAEAVADRVLLTDDASFVPSEQPVDDQIAPDAVSRFTAAKGTGQVTLVWTTPLDADFDDTVIRYRTDGKYPVGPADGFEVVISNNVPGSTDSFVHLGLEKGKTYRYSAFARDASGNVSDATQAHATPD